MGNYSYFLNCMGPISTRWYDENNIPFKMVFNEFAGKEIKQYTEYWYGGRIDILGRNLVYGEEYGVPIMKEESWRNLGEFLCNLKTETMWPYEKIIGEYEKEYGEIEWHETSRS